MKFRTFLKAPFYAAANVCWLGFLLAASCDTGPEQRNTAQDRLEVAIDTLDRTAKNIESSGDLSPQQQTMITRYRTAVAELEGQDATRLSPTLVLASLHVGSDGNPEKLLLQWVENGFDVSGFHVRGADGNEVEFPQLFRWTQDDRDWYAATSFRDQWVFFEDPGDEDSRVFIDPEDWKIGGEISIGLISDDGDRMEDEEAIIIGESG